MPTDSTALVRRNTNIIEAFVAIGVPRGLAEESVKRGSGAIAYILSNGLDSLPDIVSVIPGAATAKH